MKSNLLLQKIGLTPPLDTVYLSLLELGSETIAGIARYSGLYRPTVYKAMPVLIAKNLVSQTKRGKRTLYVAEKPLALISSIQDLKIELEEHLPRLLETYERKKQQPVIRFFEGAKGIAHVYEEIIASCKKGDILYRYESPKDYRKNGAFYPPLYRKRATGPESEIEKQVITNEKTERLRRPRLSRATRAVPAAFDPFEYDITEIIANNKVAFIDYGSKSASLIENKAFAEFQQKIFKLLFRKL